MQKLEGSSPFIRSEENPLETAGFHCPRVANGATEWGWLRSRLVYDRAACMREKSFGGRKPLTLPAFSSFTPANSPGTPCIVRLTTDPEKDWGPASRAPFVQ